MFVSFYCHAFLSLQGLLMRDRGQAPETLDNLLKSRNIPDAHQDAFKTGFAEGFLKAQALTQRTQGKACCSLLRKLRPQIPHAHFQQQWRATSPPPLSFCSMIGCSTPPVSDWWVELMGCLFGNLLVSQERAGQFKVKYISSGHSR